jgi:hypothetical protein
VSKRILPSVQHNIVKILREREVQRNKQKLEQTPERLKKDQDRMKKRQEVEKLRKTKNKQVQRQMLDALRKQEEEKLQKNQKNPDWNRLPQYYKDIDVERDQPATLIDEIESQEPKPPKHMPEPEQNALRDLYKEDIKNRRKKHQDVKDEPHVHGGLPYDPEEEGEEEE